MPCPRQSEAMMKVQLEHVQEWMWRDGYRACSYCGSLHPDDFFKFIEEGCEVQPTDKNYKAYVVVPNPNAGNPRIVSVSNHADNPEGYVPVTPEIMEQAKRDGWSSLRPTDFVQIVSDFPTQTRKFYFQHLETPEQRGRFITLHNEQKIIIGYPGHFYTTPFFCCRKSASTTAPE